METVDEIEKALNEWPSSGASEIELMIADIYKAHIERVEGNLHVAGDLQTSAFMAATDYDGADREA